MLAKIKIATGLASCAVCNKKITRGLVAVKIIGRLCACYIHSNSKDCCIERITGKPKEENNENC